MKILFQGDSITDGNRYQEPERAWDLNHQMGHSYAYIVNALMGSSYYDRNLEFVNKGNSGDRIGSLLSRFDDDFAAVNPDVVSVFVGINDCAGEKITDPKEFEKQYTELLWKLYNMNNKVKIILMEPFMLPVGRYKDNFDKPFKYLTSYQEIIRHLAKESNATHVPLQAAFCKATTLREPEYWCWDGIHPTVNGHGLIAGEWINSCKDIILGK